jgi:hypothetical protein
MAFGSTPFQQVKKYFLLIIGFSRLVLPEELSVGLDIQ